MHASFCESPYITESDYAIVLSPTGFSVDRSKGRSCYSADTDFNEERSLQIGWEAVCGCQGYYISATGEWLSTDFPRYSWRQLASRIIRETPTEYQFDSLARVARTEHGPEDATIVYSSALRKLKSALENHPTPWVVIMAGKYPASHLTYPDAAIVQALIEDVQQESVIECETQADRTDSQGNDTRDVFGLTPKRKVLAEFDMDMDLAKLQKRKPYVRISAGEEGF